MSHFESLIDSNTAIRKVEALRAARRVSESTVQPKKARASMTNARAKFGGVWAHLLDIEVGETKFFDRDDYECLDKAKRYHGSSRGWAYLIKLKPLPSITRIL
jgi:hypothetical protein